MEKPLHHFDKRIVRRSIKKGILSEDEASVHVASLPDQSGNIMPPEDESIAEEAASAGDVTADATPAGD